MKTKNIVIAIVLAVMVAFAIVWYGDENSENADNRQGVLVEIQEDADFDCICLSVKRGQLCDRM